MQPPQRAPPCLQHQRPNYAHTQDTATAAATPHCPMTQKQIWIPKSETNVTVEGHDVRVMETMTMVLKPITKPAPGFIDKRSF